MTQIMKCISPICYMYCDWLQTVSSTNFKGVLYSKN